MNEILNEIFSPSGIDDIANRIIARTRELLPLSIETETDSLRIELAARDLQIKRLEELLDKHESQIEYLQKEREAYRYPTPGSAVLGGKE